MLTEHRYPTTIYQEYPLPTGTFGCSNPTLILLRGQNGLFVKRGAEGMKSQIAEYSTIQQVRDRIGTVLQGTQGSTYYIQQTGPTTGALIYYDAALDVVDRWSLAIDTVGCKAEPYHQQRHRDLQDEILVRNLIFLYLFAYMVNDFSKNKMKLAAEVHLLDGEKGMEEVENYLVKLAPGWWATLAREVIHNEMAVSGATEIQLATLARVMHDRARTTEPDLQPSWFFRNTTMPDKRDASAPRTAPLAPSSLVYSLDDDPGSSKNAWNDVSAVTWLDVSAPLVDQRPIPEKLADSENAICSYVANNPGSRATFAPVAFQRYVTNHIYIGLASHKSQMVFGGC